MTDATPVTIESLTLAIRESRRQEAQHRADMHAAAGAAQAYEHLLGQIVRAKRDADKQIPVPGPVAPCCETGKPKADDERNTAIRPGRYHPSRNKKQKGK